MSPRGKTQRYHPSGTGYNQVRVTKAGPSTQMVVFDIGDGVVVRQLTDFRVEILREFHCSRFVIHPGGTKMYRDLRRQYYWSGMKRHVGILFDGVSRVSR